MHMGRETMTGKPLSEVKQSAEWLPCDERQWHLRKALVSWTEEDELRLEEMGKHLKEQLSRLPGHVVEGLSSHPEIAQWIGQDANRERLLETISGLLRLLFAFRMDESYVRERLRIGLACQRMGLKSDWLLSVYNEIVSAIVQSMNLLKQATAARTELFLLSLMKRIVLDLSIECYDSYFKYLADHDPLTGLFNRRRFEEELERVLAYSRQYGKTGALLFIDLDDFKRVNDTYGHTIGDQVLAFVAQSLRENLRKSDVIGRLGGDEFAVIIQDVNAEQARRVAEKLMGSLDGLQMAAGEGKVSISVSVGIALYPQHGLTKRELLDRADGAMYAAKRGGKGRCALFADEKTTDEQNPGKSLTS